jgi:UDP-2-acetamido-3-amino-2,3-dideoxy-glucuronate N-acetyltransferase
VVTRDVPAHALVTGVPARRAGWMCACGERLPADPTECAVCGSRYERAADGLRMVAAAAGVENGERGA